MKSLAEQSVFFWFVLNELAVDCEDTKGADALFDAVYKDIDAHYRSLTGFRAPDTHLGGWVERYQLCWVAGEVTDKGGRLAWPIALYANEDLNDSVLREFKELVERCFESQIAKHGGSARFVGAEKQNTFRLVETVPLAL